MNALTLHDDTTTTLTTPADDVTIVVPKHNVVAPWEEDSDDQPQVKGSD